MSKLLCDISFSIRVMPLNISLSSDSAIAGLLSDPLTILVGSDNQWLFIKSAMSYFDLV